MANRLFPSTLELNPRLITSLHLFSAVASAASILVGSLVLIGWRLDVATLKSVFPGLVTMKANAALAFVLGGVSLCVLGRGAVGRSKRWARGLAQLAAAGTALVGLLTLGEYLFGWGLGFDQLLFQESAAAIGTSSPGRMSPVAALSFFLVGCALLLLDTETRGGLRPAQTLAILVGLSSLLALLGYAYNVESLYGVASYTRMALHTALVFLLLSAGLLCARPERGLMAALMSESAGGITFRRIWPGVVSVPLLLGWLCLHGERAGLYGTGFGVVLMAVATVVVLTLLIWSNTARKLAEEEARGRREEISRLSQVGLLGEMTASIAHELNQPLSAIVSNASAGQRFIDRGDADLHKLREIMVDIATDGRRADEVIRNIRNIVKRGATSRQRLNLNDLIVNVAHMVQPDALAHSCQVKTSLAKDLPTIEADPVQIQQVLINLIGNAFDAMRDTPVRSRKVRVATKRSGDRTIRVSVRDYGVGIPDEARERLFEQFFTTKEQGLGMGLAIVRSIIEAHVGAIGAENVAGGGARFYFTLPASEASLK